MSSVSRWLAPRLAFDSRSLVETSSMKKVDRGRRREAGRKKYTGGSLAHLSRYALSTDLWITGNGENIFP